MISNTEFSLFSVNEIMLIFLLKYTGQKVIGLDSKTVV